MRNYGMNAKIHYSSIRLHVLGWTTQAQLPSFTFMAWNYRGLWLEPFLTNFHLNLHLIPRRRCWTHVEYMRLIFRCGVKIRWMVDSDKCSSATICLTPKCWSTRTTAATVLTIVFVVSLLVHQYCALTLTILRHPITLYVNDTL